MNWQNKLQDSFKVKELQEFTQYKVMVKLDSTKSPSVQYFVNQLARKSDKNSCIVIPSNWTGTLKNALNLNTKIALKFPSKPVQSQRSNNKHFLDSSKIKSVECQDMQSQSDR